MGKRLLFSSSVMYALIRHGIITYRLHIYKSTSLGWRERGYINFLALRIVTVPNHLIHCTRVRRSYARFLSLTTLGGCRSEHFAVCFSYLVFTSVPATVSIFVVFPILFNTTRIFHRGPRRAPLDFRSSDHRVKTLFFYGRLSRVDDENDERFRF